MGALNSAPKQIGYSLQDLADRLRIEVGARSYFPSFIGSTDQVTPEIADRVIQNKYIQTVYLQGYCRNYNEIKGYPSSIIPLSNNLTKLQLSYVKLDEKQILAISSSTTLTSLCLNSVNGPFECFSNNTSIRCLEISIVRRQSLDLYDSLIHLISKCHLHKLMLFNWYQDYTQRYNSDGVLSHALEDKMAPLFAQQIERKDGLQQLIERNCLRGFDWIITACSLLEKKGLRPDTLELKSLQCDWTERTLRRADFKYVWPLKVNVYSDVQLNCVPVRFGWKNITNLCFCAASNKHSVDFADICRNCTSLKKLVYHPMGADLSISFEEIKCLRNLQSLTDLKLPYLSGNHHQSLRELAHLKNLQFLYFKVSSYGSEYYADISFLDNLDYLTISNSVTLGALEDPNEAIYGISVKPPNSLRNLRLIGCKITYSILAELTLMENFQQLNLNECCWDTQVDVKRVESILASNRSLQIMSLPKKYIPSFDIKVDEKKINDWKSDLKNLDDRFWLRNHDYLVEWNSIVFVIAFVRANKLHPLQNSIIDLIHDFRGFFRESPCMIHYDRPFEHIESHYDRT